MLAAFFTIAGIFALATIAATVTALFVIGAIRVSGRADDAAEIAAQIAYGAAAIPRGSRAKVMPSHARADTL